MMKWIVPFLLLSTTAWAQAPRCDQFKTEIVRLESKIAKSQIPQCNALTPQALGLTNLTEEETLIFNSMRCQSLGALDTVLGDIETILALQDGLKDLRDQTVAGSRTLGTSGRWTSAENRVTREFTQDVTLGAMIEGILNNPSINVLFEGNTTALQWPNKLNSFCAVGAPQAASQMCALWLTYRQGGENPLISLPDLAGFLDELRPQLSNGQLSTEKKTSLLNMLKLESNGSATDFAQYHEQLVAAGIDDAVKNNRSIAMNQNQIKFLRGQTLRVPGANDAPGKLKDLVARLAESQDLTKVQSAKTLFNENISDNLSRQEARIKARWSSLYQQIMAQPGNTLKNGQSNGTIPCVGNTENLSQCIAQAWDNIDLKSKPAELDALKRSVELASTSLANQKLKFTRCTQDDVLQAWAKSQEVPNECKLNDTVTNQRFESMRRTALKIRERMRAHQEPDLKFREAAFIALQQEDCGGLQEFRPSNACQSLPGQVEFGPALALVHQSVQIFHEGLRPQQELSTSDCPAGQQGENATLCDLLFRRQDSAGNNIVRSPQVTPTTLGTDAPERTSDPIVRETLVNVAGDLANMWAQNRINQMQQPYYGWTLPTYRAMPYSQPIAMSMSDYVMSSATFYGGYGRYYQCSTCGFGTSASSFNNYWGLGSSGTVAGMGSGTLGGTSLSSSFFGGSSTLGGGSFKF